MKKNCELCKAPATTFCESDQASLCWDCDSKIHSANFLVARHVRTLLCHRCQSPTPWKASGATLSNALSLCETCGCGGGGGRKFEDEQEEESEGDNENEDDDEVDTDFDEEDEEEEELDGDEDGDNQVVPWSSTAAAPPPSSSSGSEESVSKSNDNDEEVVSKLVTINSISLKRRREEDRDFQASDSKICVDQRMYGGERRRDDGEPSSKALIRQVNDGKVTSNLSRTIELAVQ
ncbi:unnamed protein product [Vicia faba]|uniref:B box-type domain-containing protein n=1 Tax=Vicia faba TaxID=3906 RepID=A0AAV0Z4I4_VICFA|nr:unnamed protein product [Vicia faba]